MRLYITKQGDVLDAICFLHYGFTDGAVEEVVVANPKIARYPLHLPLGLELILPDLPKRIANDEVRLWD